MICITTVALGNQLTAREHQTVQILIVRLCVAQCNFNHSPNRGIDCVAAAVAETLAPAINIQIQLCTVTAAASMIPPP